MVVADFVVVASTFAAAPAFVAVVVVAFDSFVVVAAADNYMAEEVAQSLDELQA